MCVYIMCVCVCVYVNEQSRDKKSLPRFSGVLTSRGSTKSERGAEGNVLQFGGWYASNHLDIYSKNTFTY